MGEQEYHITIDYEIINFNVFVSPFTPSGIVVFLFKFRIPSIASTKAC